MARNSTIQKPFSKVADILPKGFDVEQVAEFFATGSSKPAPSKAAGVPLGLKNGFERSTFSEPSDPASDHKDNMLGNDGGISQSAFHSVVKSIFEPYNSDVDGWAKPAFKSDGNGGGGGKGKPDRGQTSPDPIVIEETTPTPTDTNDPSPTPTPAPTLVTADYISGLDTPDGYNVELMFEGTWTEAAKSAAYKAAELISDTVTGDLPSYNGIDDIRITLTSANIDGTGGTWGKGGYDILRSDTKLAATGHVTIDASDVPNALKLGLLDDLLQHEMLHAMGFGTAWSALGLVDDYSGDLRFNGANATQVYNTLFQSKAAHDPLASKGVPIETDGGSGAAGKHWDEATFGDELMSTTLNYSNNMTPLTIAALEDMGYQTTFVDSFLFA